MANIPNGTAVNFALSGTVLSSTSTDTGIGTGLMQSIDHTKERDKLEIHDEGGILVTRIWFNPGEKATLTYFTKGSGLADAITQATLPDIGTFATVATCNQYPALNKTTWEVVGATMKKTNTTAMEVTLQVEFHAGIVAHASA